MESKHLKELDVGYWDHMCFSLRLSSLMLEGSVKAIIHAIFPDVYVTSTTDITSKLHDELDMVKKHGFRSRL